MTPSASSTTDSVRLDLAAGLQSGTGGGFQGGFNPKEVRRLQAAGFGGSRRVQSASTDSQFTQGANGQSFEFDIGDIFGDFFGGSGRSRQAAKRSECNG